MMPYSTIPQIYTKSALVAKNDKLFDNFTSNFDDLAPQPSIIPDIRS